MSVVEILLLALVLIITAIGGIAIWILWKMHVKALAEWHHWHSHLDYFLEREFFEGKPSGIVRESLFSLQNSVSNLSRLSDTYQSFMTQLKRRWADPSPTCSESGTIKKMSKTLDQISKRLESPDANIPPGGKND
jgi:biopolymer transport protein ExbB/TolQ